MMESRIIGAHTYSMAYLPYGVWRRFHQMVWTSFVQISSQVLDLNTDEEREQNLRDALHSMSLLLPLNPMYQQILDIFAENTRVDTEKGYLSKQMEIWWIENGAEMWPWLAFCLEVQLLPFLRGMPLDALRRLDNPQRASNYLQSPAASTGQSGDSSEKGTAP